MYIHVVYLKTKLYGKITVFKTSLLHKHDNVYITYLYDYWNNGNTSAKQHKRAKPAQNTPVRNNTISSRML